VAVSLLTAAPAAAAPEPWSDPVTVTDQSPWLESTAVAPDGRIVATMETTLGIATVTSVDQGATWGAPVYLGSGGDYAFRSTVAVTSSGLLAAAWVEQHPFGRALQIAISGDGGATWSTPGPLPTGSSDVDDPTIVSASADAFTVMWREDNWRKVSSVSTDGGATWSALSVLTEDMNSYGVGTLVSLGAGNIAALFQEFDGDTAIYSIQSRLSTDGGLTWAPKVSVGAPWPGILGNGIDPVAVSPAAGSIIAVWTRGVGDFTTSVFASTSTDNGVTWSEPFTVGDAGYVESLTAHVVDSTSAAIVWTRFAEDTLLGYATVALGADASSEPVAVNPGNPTVYYVQNPALVASGDLRVVAWMEEGESSEGDAYRVSASCDAGATWSEPVLLASGGDLAFADPQTVVSDGVVTTTWGGYEGEQMFVFAASSATLCGSAPAPAPALPATGGELASPLLLTAGLALLAGGALVLGRRRAA
jgi:LPXTG-motif cell wall-anchored protein